jgi:ribose transport system substrate-binding protein
VDRVLGLEIEHAGTLVQSRITGSFRAMQDRLPHISLSSYFRLDGAGVQEKSARAVAEFLRACPDDRRVLISAANDTSALGALNAVRELRRERHVAIAGQDCIPEALKEMTRPGTPWVGSVSHEAASYGPALIRLGLSLLQGATVAPYNYVEHRLITAESLQSRPGPAEMGGSVRGPVLEHA